MKCDNQDLPAIRVAVMGVTGSGKSTFIRAASQLEHVKIGHSWDSCTAVVEPFDFTYKGRKITLIDTPGFNDTNKSEAAVLREIANWLDFTYRNPPHEKLNGIIYVQSILDPRMYGSSLRNLRMFKDLCGPDPMKNVILITSRWQMVEETNSQAKAEKNEKDLFAEERFWAEMISKGARPERFTDTTESALDIIDLLLEREPIVLQIQSELVDEERNLEHTSAGYTMNQEFIKLKKECAAELEQLQKEWEEAFEKKEEDVQEQLKKAERECQLQIDRIIADQEMLQYERRSDERKWSNERQALLALHKKQIEQLGAKGELDFDRTVQMLEANGGKLRKEQRAAMHHEIDEINKKPLKERTGVKLLLALLPAVGSVIFGILGLPVIGL